MQALSGNRVSSELLDAEAEAAMGHIELAKWADAILIAPATANTIARLSSGRGDDLLSTVTLAFDGPVSLAPAMNQAMWRDERTQENLDRLIQKGYEVCGPGSGEQACGDIGLGRMLEPLEILQIFSNSFTKGKMSGKRVLITAGPTQEPIDPVRFITNRSSGKMGYNLAEAAIESGARVTLISGPVDIPKPSNCNFVSVETAQEMYDAVMHHVKEKDVYIGTAAVSDYRPVNTSNLKIKKDGSGKPITLELEENKDILKSVSELQDKPYVVGFAAETDNLLVNADKKLKGKNLDLIVANDVSDKEIGFNSEQNEVTLITLKEKTLIERQSKKKVSRQIIDFISDQI